MSRPGLLGDTVARDYSRKLQLFNAFAEPEIRQVIGRLGLRPGMRILDAGCGTGEALGWLYEAVAPGYGLGIDLSQAHIDAARRVLPAAVDLTRGDVLTAASTSPGFELIWSVNTLNHLHDPQLGMTRLAERLTPGGRLVVGQTGLLCDMCFAWDARLERVVNEAVRRYYRERYGLHEEQLTGVRSLVGNLRAIGFGEVVPTTVVIERVAPLNRATQAYLLQAIFRDTWGERLRRYLSAVDFSALARLTDPRDVAFALNRPDFHFLQTLTFVVAQR